MKHLLLSALSIAALSSQALAEERQVEITVGDLTCPSCSLIVANSMRGVPSVEIDAFEEGPGTGQGIYSVTYDDSETTVENIIEAVTANGYPAQVRSDAAS